MAISLKTQAIRGTTWTLIGYGAAQALRLGSNLILTRLLVPEYFGLMSLISVFLTALTLFSDIGIGPSIIQSKRGDDPLFFNTAWTVQVIRGFGLWLASLLIAKPVATFYENPQLMWFIPIVGLTTIINGFNSTAMYTLNRQMALGKLTLLELGTQVISLFVMIVWAWFSPTVWALVGGNLVSVLARVVWSYQLVPGQSNRLIWDKEAAKELFSFGRWIFISTAMTFLAMQADRLILGKIFSLEMLGIYTVAYTFADLPKQVGSRISSKVIFPILSQLADLPRDRLRAKILQKRWLMLVGMAVFVAVLVSFGDLLVLALYDRRYKDAAWMLPILALGMWPALLPQTISPSLLAIGKPLYTAYGNFLKFIYMVIGLPLGFSMMGVFGAVLVVAFNDLPVYAADNYGLWREGLTGIGQDIKATLLLIGLIACILMSRYLLGFGLPFSEVFQ